MKKVILGLALLTVFASCSKDDSLVEENEQKMYDVSFTTNNFTQTQGDTKSTSVETAVDYAVFNSDSVFVKQIHFDANATIKDTLLAGDYTAWMIAGDYNRSFEGNQGDNMTEWYYYTYDTNNNLYGGHVKFTVDATSAENISIDLNRFTAKLVVDITDLKDEVVKTDVFISKTLGAVSLNDNLSGTWTRDNYSKQFTDNNIFMSFVPYSRDTEGNDCPDIEVTIKCWDAYQNLLAQKVIKDVKIGRNKVTTLTGTMFDGTTSDISGSAFDITLNEDWKEEIAQEF